MPPKNHVARSRRAAENFTNLFGAEDDKLASLQSLCRTCGVIECHIPGSITQCKQVSLEVLSIHHSTGIGLDPDPRPQILKTIHVNIYDIVEARRERRSVWPFQIFQSVAALKNYSWSSQKIFAKKVVKNDHRLLRVMLRHLL